MALKRARGGGSLVLNVAHDWDQPAERRARAWYTDDVASVIPPKFYAEEAGFPTRIDVTPIGVVRAPHKERHGTPRQASLAADPSLRPDERARIELFADVVGAAALSDLAEFDVVWVLSWMHLNHGFREKVLPPGETQERGLFATRAPHRPNPIGLSAARRGRTPADAARPAVTAADCLRNARRDGVSFIGRTSREGLRNVTSVACQDNPGSKPCASSRTGESVAGSCGASRAEETTTGTMRVLQAGAHC